MGSRVQMPYQQVLGEFILNPEHDLWSPGAVYRIVSREVPRRTETRASDPPPHPGDFLREELFEPKNLKIAKIARKIGVARRTLSNLVHSHADLSPDMAFKLGMEFEKQDSKYSAKNLLAIQADWDLAQIEKKFSSKNQHPEVPENSKN